MTRVTSAPGCARGRPARRPVRSLVLAVALSATAAPVLAQDASPFELSLDALLNVRVVAASRREERPFESPRSIAVITAEDLRRRNYRSTPEALQDTVGVFLQQTNDGGGAPILRGLIGNQVLLLVDGVRMNNAIYRLGPNQYLNTVDIAQIERIEIVRGPGSVLFGSDALGGVVNIVTKSRVVGDARPGSVGTSLRVATADRGTMARVGFDAGTPRLSAIGGVSVKSFGQLRAGGGTVQAFTGYDEWAGDLKLSVSPRPGHTLTFAGQHGRQSDVLRADALASGADLEYRWDPETRSLVSVRYAVARPLAFVREASLFMALQDQSERVFRRTASRPTERRRLDDGDRTLSAGMELFSAAGPHRVTYGVDLYEDWVRSRRVDHNLATGENTARRGTFADGARTTSLAAYAQDRIALGRRLSLELGLRRAWHDLELQVDDGSTAPVAVDTHNAAQTGSAYASFAVLNTLRLVAGVSRGFRAPNVDDDSFLGSFGGGFEVPNPHLKPEHSHNAMVGLKHASRLALANVSLFDASYRDLIARDTATFNGLPFLDSNGNGRQDSGEPLIYQRHNVGEARVRGLEMDGQLRVGRWWRVSGNFTWTDGRDVKADEPLRRMPPKYGGVGVAFEPSARWWAEAYSRIAGDQRRLNTGDISDIRIGPGGTDGFATVNLRGGVVVPRLGALTLGLENLLDERYKLHGSGIYRPGRNLVVGLRRDF